jgi:hypothetical protein
MIASFHILCFTTYVTVLCSFITYIGKAVFLNQSINQSINQRTDKYTHTPTYKEIGLSIIRGQGWRSQGWRSG